MQTGDLIFRLTSYADYLLAAKSKYYVHSPFVFELVNEVLNKPLPEKAEATLKGFRELQLSDHKEVTLASIGTANHDGKVFSVSELARRFSLPVKYGKLLCKLVDRLQPTDILETGTGTGFSSLCLALGNANATVYTIDALEPMIGTAKKHHRQIGLHNIRYHQGDLDNVLANVCEDIGTIDCVYLDANHTYDATIRYFNVILPFLSIKAFVIVDDIHWSRGMNNAWLELCRHERVTLSLDFYRLGVLFFSPDFSKETHRLYY